MAKKPQKRRYPDLREHVEALDRAGLLHTIDSPVNKDTEMHPLVRWQFRGGIPTHARKAFLFTNVTDSKGAAYDIPVVVGALAATPAIYSIGMGVGLNEIGPKWEEALAHPVPPVIVNTAPCQEVVVEGEDLNKPGHGLDALPIPVSTPGFDAAPYLTATNCVTKDPETGVQNMGTYRAALKARTRLGVRMATRVGGAGGYLHWLKYQERGEKMPLAIVVGCPPAVAYMGPQKLRVGQDEIEVAGALAGQPINLVQARTVDLLVPGEAEIVIEGLIDTEFLEPEGPFGESHGYVALEEFNMAMEVTAITRKAQPVMPSIISQVTPSESSTIKRVAYEPLFLTHLRDNLGVQGVEKVSMHEPLTNIRKVILVQFARGTPRTEIWRGLYGAATLQAACGKYVFAVNDDIDADNADSLLWALAYRANPAEDMQVLPHRGRGHGPKTPHDKAEDSTLLVDATAKGDLPPLALPKREYMEGAKALWENLGLPPLTPETPWHGYSLGHWTDEWDAAAARAAQGDYEVNGERSRNQRRANLKPETPVWAVPDDKDGSG